MNTLSERAQGILSDFKNNLESLPVHERDEAIRRATDILNSIHQEAKGLFGMFRSKGGDTMTADEPLSEEQQEQIDQIRDYL